MPLQWNTSAIVPTGVPEGPNSAIHGVRVAYGLLVVAWVSVLMKLSLKLVKERRRWMAHEYFSMLALAFATAEVIVIGVNVQDFGEGQHINTIPAQNLNTVFRLLDHMYIMYEMALMFVKLSILSFYLALFEIRPTFRRVNYVMIAIVVIYLTIFVFIDTFRCTPLKKMWDPATTKGNCLNGAREQRAFGIMNALSDITILIMPFPIVLRLNMTRQKIITLAIIFSIGAFTCGAAITRAIIVWKTLKSEDPTWAIGPEITWMNIEMLVGLICGALLSSPALFRHILRETRVGQSLVSLLTRRSSNSGASSGRQGSDWDGWDRFNRAKTSVSGPRPRELQELGPSVSSSKTDRVGSNDDASSVFDRPRGNSEIGVQKTVDVSVEMA